MKYDFIKNGKTLWSQSREGKGAEKRFFLAAEEQRFDRSSSYYSDPHLLQSLVGYFKIAVL